MLGILSNAVAAKLGAAPAWPGGIHSPFGPPVWPRARRPSLYILARTAHYLPAGRPSAGWRRRSARSGAGRGYSKVTAFWSARGTLPSLVKVTLCLSPTPEIGTRHS